MALSKTNKSIWFVFDFFFFLIATWYLSHDTTLMQHYDFAQYFDIYLDFFFTLFTYKSNFFCPRVPSNKQFSSHIINILTKWDFKKSNQSICQFILILVFFFLIKTILPWKILSCGTVLIFSPHRYPIWFWGKGQTGELHLIISVREYTGSVCYAFD